MPDKNPVFHATRPIPLERYFSTENNEDSQFKLAVDQPIKAVFPKQGNF